MNKQEELNVLRSATKSIKTRITGCSNIIDYLLEERSLKNSILDFFGDFDVKFQCKVAILLIDDGGIQGLARKIVEQMDSRSSHDLDMFFSQLLEMVFPNSLSFLYVEFSNFKQGSLSISEYGLRFKILCEGLGHKMQYQKIRFIEGIAKKRVRDILLKADLSRYDIQGLMDYAAGLENIALIDEKGVDETSGVYKIEVSTIHFKLAEQKGLKKGLCFNCFIGHHECFSCPSSLCKFCKKPNGQVKHFSLACVKCPSKLG